MGLRGDIGPGLRAIRPSQLVFSAALAATAIGVMGAVGMGVLSLSGSDRLAYLVMVPLCLVVVLPALAGLYAPLTSPRDGFGATVRQAGAAVRTAYRPLFVANAASVGVATAGGVGAMLSWYVLATAGTVSLALAAGARVAPTTAILDELVVAFFVGFGAFLLATRFVDRFVLVEDVDYRTALRLSVAFARGNPLSFLGYAAVSLGLFKATTVSLSVLNEYVPRSPVEIGAWLAVAVIGGAATLVWAAIHVTYFQRTVVSATPDPAAVVSPPWKRIVVVGVVVLSLAVVGAGAVRVADVGASDGSIDALPADPEAAYAVAIENTAASSRRVVVERRNRTAGEPYRLVRRQGVDVEQRRLYVYYYDDGDARGGFLGQGTYTRRFGGAADGTGSLASTTATGAWRIEQRPAFESETVDRSELPVADADPRVAAENDSTIVYAFDRSAVIEDVLTDADYRGMEGGLANGSRLRVVVDRERGVVRQVRATFVSRETGHAFDYRWRYSEVGTADIERPEAIGPRRPMAWVWDALLY